MKLNDGVEVEEVGEDVIVIDTINGRFLELNQMGSIILNQLLQGTSVQDIAKELSETFGKPYYEAIVMINDFVKRLVELEIICRYE